MADIYTMNDQGSNKGVIGGGLVGATVGSQAANAVKDILRAKGVVKKHPYLASLSGAAIGAGSILGGLVAGSKLTSKKKNDLDLVITANELDEIAAKRKHRGIRKVAKLWFPLF